MTKRFPVALILLLLAIAAYMASRTERFFNAGAAATTLPDALYRLVGSAKEILGDRMFLKADAYYHGGVTGEFMDSAEDFHKEGLIDKAGDGGERGPSFDWIAGVNAQVRSHRHYHLTRNEQKEMLPFFNLAVRLDPYNVEAILTTAYWLDSYFGKTREAIRVLKDGMKNNPDEWQIDYNLAKIYFKRMRNFAISEVLYLQAIHKMQKKEADIKILIDCYYLLGESRRYQGKREEALSAYEEASRLYEGKKADPLKDMIAARIKELSQVTAIKIVSFRAEREISSEEISRPSASK